MEFWQQLLSTLFGAFAGACAALGTGFLVRRRESRDEEEAALNGLLLDLQFKRALALIEPKLSQAAGSQDLKRCSDSVLHSRELIREARLKLRPKSPAFENLARMSAACNTYLQAARRDPDEYQFALMSLRSALDDEAKHLGSSKGVTYRKPGSYAYSSPAA